MRRTTLYRRNSPQTQDHNKSDGGEKASLSMVESLQRGLEMLLPDESGKAMMSDVTFLVGKEQRAISGHRLLFATHSEPFRAMLFGPMREGKASNLLGLVQLPDMEPHVFCLLQRFLYTGHVQVEANDVRPLFCAAHTWAVHTVAEACSSTLRSALDQRNALSLFELAYLYGDIALREQCIRFIGTCVAAFLNSEELMAFSPSILSALLESSELCVGEAELFRMVLRWRDVDPLGRQKDVLELVKLIRLPLISPKDLFSLVKPSGLVSLEALFEAMAYHANPRCIPDTTLVQFQPRGSRELCKGQHIARYAWPCCNRYQIWWSQGCVCRHVMGKHGLAGEKTIHLRGVL